MDEKEAVIKKVHRIIGHMPIGTRDLLNVLAHPDVIELTKAFLERMDTASACQKYKAPWSCVKEAEAYYRNIEFGWVGASSHEHDDSWCVSCWDKVKANKDGDRMTEEELIQTLSPDELRVLGLTDRDGC